MPIDMDHEAKTLQAMLAFRGRTHLHVIKRGKALTIASGSPEDPEPEVRLTLLGKGAWRLDLRHHTGRWEQTPFVGDLTEMLEAAADMGRLDDFGPPGPWNSGDTFDPSH